MLGGAVRERIAHHRQVAYPGAGVKGRLAKCALARRPSELPPPVNYATSIT